MSLLVAVGHLAAPCAVLVVCVQLCGTRALVADVCCTQKLPKCASGGSVGLRVGCCERYVGAPGVPFEGFVAM